MARGHRDYEKAVVSVESEGFVNPHGRVLMYDNFEDTPFKWNTIGDGIHAETRQQRAAYNGSLGVELNVISNAPPNERYSGIAREIPVDITRRMIAELFWRTNELDWLASFIIELTRWTGTWQERGTLIYNGATETWNYLNDVGGNTPLTNGLQTFYDGAWNEFTLSIDFQTDEYITFKSNDLEINMGAIPIHRTLSGLGAHAAIVIAAFNITANQLIVSIDDVIVRELEV